MRRYLTDPRLLLFAVLVIGASIISAHGALLFFGYLVDPWLAGVFTAVVAVGIIGLDAAGTLERGWRRAPYYAGMAFFIVLETLANYFAGQAGFVGQIQQALREKPASDLLRIASSDPAATRSLVVLFLSPASLAVALFVFAATKRVIQIRAGGDAPLVARLARLVGVLRMRRALIRRLVARLREVRGLERKARGELAALAEQSRNLVDRKARLVALSRQRRTLVRRLVGELRIARDSLADLVAESRELRGRLAGAEGKLADSSRELGAARGEANELRSRLAAADASLAASEQDLTELREWRAGLIPSRALILAYVRGALHESRALDEISREVDIPASTLRSWLQRPVVAEANGHMEEA